MGHYVEAGNESFPTVRVGDVQPLDKSSGDWLVQELWSWRAVGVLGGPPKSGKTWAAVDLALSVASGTKALGAYPVPRPGPVVFFAAEDAPSRIRERFAAIARRRGLALEAIDVHLLDVPSLRLDDAKSQRRLSQTLRSLRPRLLVLDPLVRLHRADENSSTEISGLLSFLRSIERELETAVLLVHHTRKDLGVNAQPGQGLRGSSDLWAFGDSNLYLRRTRADRILLTIEHRSAPSPDPVSLALVSAPEPHLEIVVEQEEDRDPKPKKPTLTDEILSEIRNSPSPLRLDELRGRLRVRKQRLVEALRELAEADLVERSGDGYVQKQLSFE
jgi:hypothetical protein